MSEPDRPLRILSACMVVGAILLVLFIVLGFVFGWVGWQ